MPMALSSLHPLIRTWFTETYGEPTPVQAAAWPAVEAGEHILALAPTGSGKTLAAFLVGLSRFAQGAYPPDALSVLYVSPLKALNEDIKWNLRDPLRSIQERFAREGQPFPELRVESRSGDTPQSERRRFLSKPPSILAITPESLAILLLNPRSRSVLSKVRCVILDEVHALLGNKRGAFLSCQIARLSLVAGDFQRIALSATVRPPEVAAAWVGGPGRTVRVIQPQMAKEISVTVEFPETPLPGPTWTSGDEHFQGRYEALVQVIAQRLGKNRTTLVFTDSRRRAERIAFLLNDHLGQGTAFAHHGSLSKEVRRAVEARLVDGSLPCVVATGSLELGIDIGSVDEVILAGSPSSASVALQRIGRAGHGVGRVSRATIVPFHGMDLLDAAALSGAVEDREIEEIHPIENPLDILAQILLALCLEEPRNVDALFALIRTFPPFHALGRPAYDGVIELLAGRYDASRLRDLKPRLYFDRAAGTLTCADGVLAQLYSSGGAIPDRGYYSMRLEDGAKIGELDEEFVWERRAGDTFSFGSRAWKILSISPESVQVVPLDRPADFMPFWRAEARNRSSILARRTLEFLSAVQNGGDAHALAQRLPFTEAAGASLAHFLEAQQHAQGRVSLSGPSFTAIEICADPSRHGESLSVLIHTLRGGGVNHPLALALGAELEERLGMRIETIADDEGVLLIMPLVGIENPETLLRAALFRLGSRDSRDRLLKERLEGSGIFGAAFREAAERSLLLPRGGFGKRMPLWITRRRAKRLFDEVSGYGDFPVVVEAYRSCLADFFDMPSFNEYCDSLGSGALGLGFFHTRSPSPFARNALWRETNRFLYEGDDAPARSGGSASDQAIQGALGEARLRPVLKAETILAFQSRLRRELPGWAPEDALSLAEWVKERVGIPEDEWERLVALAGPDLRESLDSDPGLEGRILRYTCPGATSPILIHRERHEAWTNDPLSLLGEWLRCEGPLHTDRILEVFGGPKAELEDALDALVDAGTLVRDVEAEGPIGGSAIPGAEPEGKPLPAMGGLFCDRENLELLLRLQRRSARPQVRERPVSLLVPFLARRQGLGQGAALPWESLSGFAAPVSLWETELFPARFPAYRPELLDGAIAEGNLLWYGAGKGKVSLCPLEDFDLVGDVDGPSAQSRASLPSTAPAGLVGAAPAAVDSPFGDADRPRDFWELRDALVASMGTYSGAGETISALRLCEKRLWDEVWAGRMSSDTWESLRRGLETDFGEKEDPAAAAHAAGSAISSSVGGNVHPSTRPSSRSLPRSLPRALRNRWRSGPPVAGLWFSLGADPGARSGAASGAATAAWEAQDWALEQEEIDRDRIRLLIRRWGLLCRPILEREGGPLSWSRLLPAMRRLELAGELIAGRFFSGLPGPQFANPQIAQDLDACEAEKGAYWMNALDPASPAGLSADGLDPNLPARIGTARLSYLGSRLAAVSLRNGKDLRVFLPPGDPQLQQALAFLTVPRKRTVRPERKVVVETIQGVAAASSAGAVSATTAGAGDSGVAGAGDAAIAGAGDAVAAPARSSAASSPYAPVLRTLGFEADRGRMVLW